MVTHDAQVRKLMEELAKHGRVGLASMRAGMDRKTGRKYMKMGKLPSQIKEERTWRTRQDPFAKDWPEIAARLRDAPELEAKSLFEDLLGRKPGRYDPSQLRTFQRRLKQWRATEGPPKEVYFAQIHPRGEASQTDFTSCDSLQITICGEPFAHKLCHVVLPWSNWQWATVCRSESMAALRRGVQCAFFRLGHVPKFHQTDNSTAATHKVGPGKREFNEEYLALMKHLEMEPRTIEIGESNQNGDVEALHGVLKRRLEQHLLLRGSRDFESVDTYEAWVQEVLSQANSLRQKKLRQELEAMRPLRKSRLSEWTEVDVGVSPWSTIRIRQNSYSVPSRLVGEQVRVRIYDDRLEVFYGGRLQERIERLHGKNGHRIHYRHIIWSLVRKPAAFRAYRYREDLFPTLAFRRVYDALKSALDERKADIEYLRILHLAAATMEADVETALELLFETGEVPRYDAVKALVRPETIEVPELSVPQVDLRPYDELLGLEEVAS